MEKKPNSNLYKNSSSIVFFLLLNREKTEASSSRVLATYEESLGGLALCHQETTEDKVKLSVLILNKNQRDTVTNKIHRVSQELLKEKFLLGYTLA